jgi:peptide chain release factor 1
LSDPSTDSELRSIAEDELVGTSEQFEQVSTELKKSLIPVHPFANLPCLLELRPGVGGNEAAIFAGDLLRMYQGYCRQHRLRANLVSLVQNEGMGDNEVQEAILEIDTEGAYGILRCEAGVHRVQRIPATETKGRTHTSAVSVIVLPSFPPNAADTLGESSFDDPSSDYYVDPKDVRTDVMRAKGAGGQHVNTTDSAVRLTHEPTGTVVSMQDSRSQHQNREKAWQILRSRIAQERREKREAEVAAMRRGVVGVSKTGRGDKIRTYNWGQQRVTDHRSGFTLHSLDDVMSGGSELDEVMQSVRTWMTEQELLALAAEDTEK